VLCGRVCLARFDVSIQKALRQISYTADLWSDQHPWSYVALTTHWIHRRADGTLELRSDLVAFHHVYGVHGSPEMAKTMEGLLDRLGMIDKVSLTLFSPLGALFIRPWVTRQCIGP
jgi:hypothetical protein